MIFVTATLKDRAEPPQGWLLPWQTKFIIGESGARYDIDPERGIHAVTNPPNTPSDDAMTAIDRLRV